MFGSETLAEGLAELADRGALGRVWQRDPTLWRPDPARQAEITDRLGWLDLPETMRPRVPEVVGFVDEIRSEGIRHVVLCGMGGSSLAPVVFRDVFGSAEGFPELTVLDSTDPTTVRAVDARIDPVRTLFVTSSKSGGTIEVAAMLAHFWEATGERGSAFCAITDPGTSLESLARERDFRRVFLNPSDLGGRYSALSLFGLVPAALAGVDIARLLESAAGEREMSLPERDLARVPAAVLGALIGSFGRSGRGKLTLLTSPTLASFGLWVEQLIAESTGKEGKGVVPVVGEPVGDASAYGNDRCFVVARLKGESVAGLDAGVGEIHPLLDEEVPDRYGLGSLMYRWELATALAGALLGIHPFDQPNVQESKDNTARVLKEGAPREQLQGVTIAPDDAPRLRELLHTAPAGGYLALQAYLPMEVGIETSLNEIRRSIRDHGKLATTLGFGPRFLHSTGQLHKGGPATGIFLQITYKPGEDLAVPGQSYSFGQLLAAQADGDLQSLLSRGFPCLRVHLGRDVAGGLKAIAASLRVALS